MLSLLLWRDFLRHCGPSAARSPSIRASTSIAAGAPLPDIRRKLADLCRRHDPYDPAMERMARKLESLGPPE
jgi:hypothetical protein